jgi:hypothetical protein
VGSHGCTLLPSCKWNGFQLSISDSTMMHMAMVVEAIWVLKMRMCTAINYKWLAAAMKPDLQATSG